MPPRSLHLRGLPVLVANIGSEGFPPEASLKLDAIESGYAVPFIRLNLHVWCIDLSIRLRRFRGSVRGLAEQAQSIETERFDETTTQLLWAREASPRTSLPASA